MKRFKKLFMLGLVLLLSLVIAACGGDSASESSSDSGSSSNTSGGSDSSSDSKSVSQEVKTVNIGYSGPLSGPAAFYGERTLSGLELAANEINEDGGFEVNGQKYEINLVTLDDKYLPNETAANAKRLLQENDVSVIFTPHSGGVMAMQVFNEQEKFLIMAYTSEPDITAGGNKLTVAIPPKYDGYMEPFSNYVMERFGNKIAALPTASQYGKDWTETLLPHWEKSGGEVVYNASIDFAKDTDFFTIITNALNENPDVLFIGGPSEPVAKVAKQARQLGFEGGFIIMDQAKLDEMKSVTETYETFEGGIGVMPLRHAKYPGTPNFIKKYEEEYSEVPGSEAGLNYLGLVTLVEAMKAAGTVEDAEAIRAAFPEAMKNVPDEKKVYDIPNITDNGNFDAVLSVAAIENGEIVPIPVD
jgi:branched-chain amino acid transport system substrate-binding protein